MNLAFSLPPMQEGAVQGCSLSGYSLSWASTAAAETAAKMMAAGWSGGVAPQIWRFLGPTWILASLPLGYDLRDLEHVQALSPGKQRRNKFSQNVKCC